MQLCVAWGRPPGPKSWGTSPQNFCLFTFFTHFFMKLCFGNFAKWSGQNLSKNGIWGIVEISISDPSLNQNFLVTRLYMAVMEGLRTSCHLAPNWVKTVIQKSSGVARIFFWQNLNQKISQLSKTPPFGWGAEGSLQKSESIDTARRGSNCPRPKLLIYCPGGDPELPLGYRSIHHTSVCSVLAWKRRGESQKFLPCFRRKPISQLPKQSQELSSFIDLSQWLNELSRGPGKLVLIIRRWK